MIYQMVAENQLKKHIALAVTNVITIVLSNG